MNNSLRLFLICFLLFPAMVLPQVMTNRVVATIGSEPVTLLEVRQNWLLLVISNKYADMQATPSEQALQDVLDEVIEKRLLLSYAEEKSLVVDTGIIDEAIQTLWPRILRRLQSYPGYRNLMSEYGLDDESLKKLLMAQQKSDIILSQVILPRISVSQQEIDSFAEQLRNENKPLAGYRISQIIIPFTDDTKEKTLKRAYTILAQLQQGSDFPELARNLSQSDPSIQYAGDIGYISPETLHPLVADAVKDKPAGSFIAPLLIDRNILILYIVDKIAPRDMLMRNKYYEAKSELLSRLREKQHVNIFYEKK